MFEVWGSVGRSEAGVQDISVRLDHQRHRVRRVEGGFYPTDTYFKDWETEPKKDGNRSPKPLQADSFPALGSFPLDYETERRYRRDDSSQTLFPDLRCVQRTHKMYNDRLHRRFLFSVCKDQA